MVRDRAISHRFLRSTAPNVPYVPHLNPFWLNPEQTKNMGTGPSLWQAPNYGIPCPNILDKVVVWTFLRLLLKPTILKKHILEFYCSKETCFYDLKYGPVFIHIIIYLIYSLCF